MKEQIYVERLRLNEEKQWVWTPELEEFNLTEDFGIDENNLSAEICKQGQLMVRYGGINGEVSANLSRKEENAKLVYAQVWGALKSQAEAAGQKMTVDSLTAEATKDPAYQKALSTLHLLRAESLKTDHWWRSCLKKADLLNALAFRQNAEIKRY